MQFEPERMNTHIVARILVKVCQKKTTLFWWLIIYLLSVVFLIEGSYGYASSRIQPLPLLDSRKSGNASSFTCTEGRFMMIKLECQAYFVWVVCFSKWRSSSSHSLFSHTTLRYLSMQNFNLCLELKAWIGVIGFALADWEVPAVLGWSCQEPSHSHRDCSRYIYGTRLVT